jgi:hypothetical protein
MTTFTPTTYIFQIDLLWDTWTGEDDPEYVNDEWEDFEEEEEWDWGFNTLTIGEAKQIALTYPIERICLEDTILLLNIEQNRLGQCTTEAEWREWNTLTFESQRAVKQYYELYEAISLAERIQTFATEHEIYQFEAFLDEQISKWMGQEGE